MSASVGAILASGYWDTQTGAPTAAPGAGKYLADVWAAPTLLAISGTDKDGYDRHAGLVSLQVGDQLIQTSPADSQNYQEFSVGVITDNATWVQLAVTVTGQGSAFAAPGSNQNMLLQALSLQPAPDSGGCIPWQSWAPPLDPPTAGGLPVDQATCIADSWWPIDPHLCAAMQWEAYAASLAPTHGVVQVSTGAQSVMYATRGGAPVPTGDYGLAIQRAEWHRSFVTSMVGVPMLSHPQPSLAYAFGYDNWWPVDPAPGPAPVRRR